MIISLVAAVAENRVIGAGNRLPWHLPADLRHFKAITMGKPIVMGRRTFESIGRALPGRHNIVLTRDPTFLAEGCSVTGSADAALAACGDAPEAMVIGGAGVYAQFLPLADRLYLTCIHASFDGDTYFPELDEADWRETARADHGPDDRNHFAFSFVRLERRGRKAAGIQG